MKYYRLFIAGGNLAGLARMDCYEAFPEGDRPETGTFRCHCCRELYQGCDMYFYPAISAAYYHLQICRDCAGVAC